MEQSKYVIANCPAIYGVFLDGCKKDHYEDGTALCQDCTDCILKQIVELCKPLNTKQPESYYNLEVLLAKRILKLLDIQEVE